MRYSLSIFDIEIGEFTLEEIKILTQRNKDIKVNCTCCKEAWLTLEDLENQYELDLILLGDQVYWSLEDMIDDALADFEELNKLGLVSVDEVIEYFFQENDEQRWEQGVADVPSIQWATTHES